MITLKKLNLTINNNLIIDNFTYTFNNKVTAIVGKSGCGKTQLLKQIINNNNEHIISSNTNYGYMPQDLLLFNWYDVKTNLQLFNKFNQDIDNLLSEFDLLHLKNKFINDLSGGEQSRVAFLRAFLMSDKYLILDEPFSKLDYITHNEILKWLKEILDKYDKNIIIVTHNIDEAMLLADEIIVLQTKCRLSNKFNKPYRKEKIIQSL